MVMRSRVPWIHVWIDWFSVFYSFFCSGFGCHERPSYFEIQLTEFLYIFALFIFLFLLVRLCDWIRAATKTAYKLLFFFLFEYFDLALTFVSLYCLIAFATFTTTGFYTSPFLAGFSLSWFQLWIVIFSSVIDAMRKLPATAWHTKKQSFFFKFKFFEMGHPCVIDVSRLIS